VLQIGGVIQNAGDFNGAEDPRNTGPALGLRNLLTEPISASASRRTETVVRYGSFRCLERLRSCNSSIIRFLKRVIPANSFRSQVISQNADTRSGRHCRLRLGSCGIAGM
jgi:hypothetical protein